MLLFLNDIAGSEVVLILVFILIFFGSKSIPGIAQTLGKTMRQIKDASQDVQNEIAKSGLDIKKDLNLKGIIRETADDIRKPLDQMAVDVNQAMDLSRKPYSPPPKINPESGMVASESEMPENKIDVVAPEPIELNKEPIEKSKE